MKKILSKILGCTMAVTVLASGLVGCSGESKDWTKPTLVSWGESVSQNGGFVAETGNYVYYINGIPNATADNTLGVPVKGSLMVMDKADPSKTQTVVPRLLAASDYDAGVFVWKGYAYYATPNTDKDSTGAIASNEMVFERTKLDGSVTERLFVPGGDLSTKYRIVENGDNVYIVYYDTEDTALKVYDVAAKQLKVIAKTDAQGESNYSLGEYFFTVDQNGEIAVAYTVTVYSEAYIEDKAQQPGYQRGTQNYNYLMLYKGGDVADQTTNMLGKIVCGSKDVEATYAFTFVEKDKIIFTETSVTGQEKTYGAAIATLYADGSKKEVVNVDYAKEGTLIKSLDEVYFVAENKLYRSTLVANDKEIKQVVATDVTVSLLFDVYDGDVYYLNDKNVMMRKQLENADAKEVQVSEGAVLTGWFAPELVSFGGKTHMFYVDETTTGLSYTHYVDLGAEVVEEDSDDDGEADIFNLGKSTFVGIRTEEDKAAIVGAHIDDVSKGMSSNNVLLLDKDDQGKLYSERVNFARAEYDKLSAETKELVNSEKATKLTQYEKAISMANIYAKLDGMLGYDNKTTEEQQAVKAVYDQVKGDIVAFIATDEYETIAAFIPTNYKANYSEALKKFESKK